MRTGTTSMRLAPGVYLRILHYAPPYGDEAKREEQTQQQNVVEGKA